MATNLNAGSIAIIGFNGSNPDDFSFVLLSAVEAGTEIFFTDAGVIQGTDQFADDDEGVIRWTASTDYAAGTVINLTADALEFDTPGQMTLFGSFELSNVGDQLIAFQAEIDPVTSELVDKRFLFMVQSNSTTR